MSLSKYLPDCSRTTLVLAGTGALAIGVTAWWMYSSNGSTSHIDRAAFDFDRSEPPQIADADLAFLSAYTGEADLEALRARLLSWWRKVKQQGHVYRCIQEMMFLNPMIEQHKAYKALLYKAKKADASFRVADVGCCFGQDTRRMVLDGVPASSIWAIDLTPTYWEASKALFKDGPSTSSSSRLAGVHTLFGDMSAVPMTPSAIELESNNLLTSFDFVVAMAVLHVMTREKGERFLSRCHSLLSPKGVFFGWCIGSPDPYGSTWCARGGGDPNALHTRFLHSKETLTAALEELGFVDVEVTSVELESSLQANDVTKTRLGFIAKRGA